MAVRFPTLRSGSKGDSVKNLQITINTWAKTYNREDFYTGVPDGIYGSKTKAAIMAIQTALGLTADGVVGPNTWDVIQKTGLAIAQGKAVLFKPPVKSSGATVTAQDLAPSKIPPPSGGYDIFGMFGDLDWKLVGASIIIGVGLLFMAGKRKK